MLSIVIPEQEFYDDKKQEFFTAKAQPLQLEHSLVSLSKWESKWCKPFLLNKAKTYEEQLDYIKCMTITQNVNPEVYLRITPALFSEVQAYIDAPMTATTFSKIQGGKSSSELVTSELIYYWMISLNIPFECQKWHLNRLLTLIKVCELKNQPKKKMSRRDVMSRNASINAARRKQLNSKG